ncbi:MAG: IPT/TIG domain-containing protein, partial [Acidovorax sp.]|uniref:IPT/TIG domain-containing protein n=1 Tax=Acidovorax sp. TaxID=1872122 RepID=UPI00391B30E8
LHDRTARQFVQLNGVRLWPQRAWVEEGTGLHVLEFVALEGQGGNVSLLAGVASSSGQLWRSAAVQWGYSPPQLTGINTEEGPSRDVMRLLLFGRNFGPHPVVLVNGAPVDVTLATHTYIEALYPGDQGAVVVAAGDQVSNERTFAFFSPLIIADRLGSGDASETAGRFRTSGGALLVLRGKYFGHDNVTVTVGGKLCTELTLTPDPAEEDVSEVSCRVPPGEGT